jgi:hypothetical protein
VIGCMAFLRLYAHALTLAAWAVIAWVLQIEPDPGVITLILSTLAMSAFAAERERSRRRRESRRA